MKKVAILFSAFFSLNAAIAQTARVQVIHNCADRAADSVDIYLGSTRLLDNFAFRTATPFIDAPAGIPVVIGVAPKNSTSVADTIFSTTVTLTASQKYILVANGIVSPTGYMPGAATAPFRLSTYAMAHEVADTAGRTDVLVLHGCTDAPTVDVRAGAAVLVNDVAFGQFNSAGYLSLPTANYTIDVTNSAGTATVQSYSAPLATLGLTDSAITVLASGFLDSTVNSNGRKFGLWVALRSGGALIPLPTVPSTAVTSVDMPVEASVYPNPATHTLHVSANGNIENIAITDISGKIITTANETNSATFNTSALPQGIYLVRLTDAAGKVTVQKFTKN